jgi:phosphatidylglycerol:prolipoprotein diacylglycerol transferase
VHPILFHLGPVLIPAYGALAAVGVLLALLLAQGMADKAGLDSNAIWNLCVVSLLGVLVGARLLLIAVNWSVLRQHPAWLLGLGMVHHPLVTAVGLVCGAACGLGYASWKRIPLPRTADLLAAPVLVAAALEQLGALLAGSGYGVEAEGWARRWAVTYDDILAARWSGAPLGIAVHPVQAYAALGFLVVAVGLLFGLPRLPRAGDGAGLGLMAAGVVVFFSEFWRDPEGRGWWWSGAVNGPQLAAVGMVLVGGLVLAEWKRPTGG